MITQPISSAVGTIDWRAEVERMFQEETARGSYQRNTPASIAQLGVLICNYLVKHVAGCSGAELATRLEGTCVGLGLDVTVLPVVIGELLAAGKLIEIEIEKAHEWPVGSGWFSAQRLIRISPQAWIEAMA